MSIILRGLGECELVHSTQPVGLFECFAHTCQSGVKLVCALRCDAVVGVGRHAHILQGVHVQTLGESTGGPNQYNCHIGIQAVAAAFICKPLLVCNEYDS